MITIFYSVFALLLGIGIFIIGSGLLGTTVALQANGAGFSDGVIGVVMSAYFVGFVVGTYVFPHLVKRVGHVRTFSAAAATGAAAVLLHPMLVWPLAWGILRFVTGFCVLGLYMVIESWLNEKATNQSRGRIFALYQGISLAGLALGQYLILVGDIASAMPFMIAAALFSLGLVPIALTRIEEPDAIRSVELDLKQLWRISPLGTAGAAMAGLANGTLFALGPVFASHAGMSTSTIAVFMSIVVLGGMLLQWPVGHLSDFRDRRIVIFVVALMGTVVAGLATVLVGHSLIWFMSAAFLYGGAAFTLYPLSVAHSNDRTERRDLLKTASGLLLLYGAGAVIGPVVAGQIMGWFGPGSFFTMLMAVQGLLMLFVGYRMWVRPAKPGEIHEPFTPLVRTSHAALEMLPELSDDLAPAREVAKENLPIG